MAYIFSFIMLGETFVIRWLKFSDYQENAKQVNFWELIHQ